MPIKSGAGSVLMYGLSMEQLYDHFGGNLAKTILNVMLACGKLGKFSNLTLEFNLLTQ